MNSRPSPELSPSWTGPRSTFGVCFACTRPGPSSLSAPSRICCGGGATRPLDKQLDLHCDQTIVLTGPRTVAK